MRKLRTLNGLVYFFTDAAYEKLTTDYNPSQEELLHYALAVIDVKKCEIVKTKHPLEDVFTQALKGE